MALRSALRSPLLSALRPAIGDGVGGISTIGADLAMWFDTNQAYKSSGGGIVTPDSILTYTAPSPKLVYGADGILGYAPHNLCLQSQTFNTTWSLGSNSVTANQDVAPDGTTTADLVTMVLASSVFQTIAVSASTTYTFSFWAKRGTKTNLQYRVYDNIGAANITAPTSYYSSTSAGAFSRITHTFTTPAGCTSLRVYIDDSNDGTSGTFLVWGAQLNLGSSALTYIPTTTAAVYSLPRDHNPTTGAPLGVLVEEQRTNFVRNNSMVGAVAGSPGTNPTNWGGTTSLSNGIQRSVVGVGVEFGLPYIDIRLLGTATANVTNAQIGFESGGCACTVGNVVTSSLFASVLPGGIGVGTNFRVVNNWNNVGVYLSESQGTLTQLTSTITRLTVTATAIASTTTAVPYMKWHETAGTVTDYVLRLYAPQTELGAFATSLILTSGSQVTRAADQVSILTSAFPYSATAGTVALVARPILANSLGAAASLNDGTGNEEIVLYRDASGNLVYQVEDGGADQLDPLDSGQNAANLTEYKMAAAWAANDFATAVGGNAAVTDTSGTLPTVTTLEVGVNQANNYLNGHIKRLAYYASRKTNAELQVLST
jgi:hypothetical protein